MKKIISYKLSFFILSIIGIVMIYSASMIWAEYKYNNQYYYLVRQLIFYIIALILYFIFLKLDYKKLKKYTNLLFLISILLLLIVLVPGIGIKRNGARSWIGIGILSFQPSELVKVTFILFTAKYLSNDPKAFKSTKKLFLYSTIILLIFSLIMLEPDFGSGVILVFTIFLMMYKELMPNKIIFISFLIIGIFGFILIKIAPYRMTRITSYLNPWADPLGSGFQIIQSLFSISPTGLFGYGLFNSRQKFYYLPEPQTDFIFAICVEELGLIGGIIILILFANIIYIGYKASMHCNNLFGANLLFGFTSLLFIQVFVNIGVVIGLLPVTGITLPFLSYGGSSLIINFIIMGILSNILSSNDIEPIFNHNRKLFF